MYKIAYHKVDKPVRKAMDKETSKKMFSRDTKLTIHEADEFLDTLCQVNTKSKKDNDILIVTILIIDEQEAKDYVMTLKVRREQHPSILALIFDDLCTEETKAEMGEEAREQISNGLLKQYQDEQKKLQDSKTDMSDFLDIQIPEDVPDLTAAEAEIIKNTVGSENPVEGNGAEAGDGTRVWRAEERFVMDEAEPQQPEPESQTVSLQEHEVAIPDEEPAEFVKETEVTFPDHETYVHVPEGDVLFEQNKVRWDTGFLLKYLEIPESSELRPLDERKRDFALSVLTGPRFSALCDDFGNRYNELIANTEDYLASVHNKAIETDYQKEAEHAEADTLKRIDEDISVDLAEYRESQEAEYAAKCDMCDKELNMKLDSYKKTLAAEKYEFTQKEAAKKNEGITAYKVQVRRKGDQEKKAVILKREENLRHEWSNGLAEARRKAIARMREQFQKAADEMWQTVQSALEEIKTEIDSKAPQWEKEIAEMEHRERSRRMEERREKSLSIKEQTAETQIACLQETATEIVDTCGKKMSDTAIEMAERMGSMETRIDKIMEGMTANTEKQQAVKRARRGKAAAVVSGVLLSMVVVAGCCFGVYYFQNYRNGVETSINALQNQITEYQDTITSQKSDIDTLEGQLSSATDEISGYLGMVSTLENQLDEADSRQAEYDAQISSYEQSISELRIELEMLRGVGNETGENQ